MKKKNTRVYDSIGYRWKKRKEQIPPASRGEGGRPNSNRLVNITSAFLEPIKVRDINWLAAWCLEMDYHPQVERELKLVGGQPWRV